MQKAIWRTLGPAGFALILTASAVNAQDTVRVRGTIDRVEGPVYIVKSRDGSELKVLLADNGGVTAIVKASLSDIKQGSFVGVAGMPQADGSQKAKCSYSRKRCAAPGKGTIRGMFGHRAR
jgi:hypothetical protein